MTKQKSKQQKSMIPLYQIFDSLFPLGSYALSNGMETYTQKGIVNDRESLTDYLVAQLYTIPYGDLGIAAKAANGEDFIMLDDLCSAMKQPFEVRQASIKLGTRLLNTVGGFADFPSLAKVSSAIKDGSCEGHYPVVVGLLVRDLDVDVGKAMELYAYSLLSVMVNHAVKLVPLGQKHAQPALHDAMKLIPVAVDKALNASIDEFGVSGCGFDLRAIQHETLFGRLFGS
jgi:urease accessory protein